MRVCYSLAHALLRVYSLAHALLTRARYSKTSAPKKFSPE